VALSSAIARVSPACLLVLTACGGPARAPAAQPPTLLVSDRGGAFRIYEEIGEGAARVVGDADGVTHADTMPARLPDGGIVFVSDRDGNPEIYLASAGGVVRRLTSDPPASPADDSAPAPLGRDRIVFARTEPGTSRGAPRDLYVMRLDDGGLRRLTRHPADDAEPWGSSDGRAVVFVSDRSGETRIYLIPDADAADPEAGTLCLSEFGPPRSPDAAGARGYADHGPVFLPDGSIVFSRKPEGGVPQLYVLGRAGASGGWRQVTDGLTLPYGAAEPVPFDDRSILLVTGLGADVEKRSGGGRSAVYRIALGGFNLARVTRERARYSDFTRRLSGG